MAVSKSLAAVFEPSNLRRAWRWISNNPDRLYKDLCASSHADHSQVIDDILSDLRDRGLRRLYEPVPAHKIELAKPRQLSRTYSILTTEDQIVYQAMVNVIAERLESLISHRFLLTNFGNLYAGKKSPAFYRDWRRCRQEYMRRARIAYQGGLKHTVTFDLAACYDTINHSVVNSALERLGFDEAFNEFFLALLRRWSSFSPDSPCLSCGIPQGPVGSGLVAEMVLEAFDREFDCLIDARYLRWVDDFRIFGRSSEALNGYVWKLEQIGKSLGLHPQPSKVDTYEIKDIDADLKSISVPPENIRTRGKMDQAKLRGRIAQLTPRYEVTNETRFRYLVPQAATNVWLTKRLIKVLVRRPDLFVTIVKYLRKHRQFPKNCAEQLLHLVRDEKIRPFVRAHVLKSVTGRMSFRQNAAVTRTARILMVQGPTDLKISSSTWLSSQGLIGPRRSRMLASTGPWFGRTELLRSLNNLGLSLTQIAAILAHQLCDRNSEVACTAAVRCIQLKLVPLAKTGRLNPTAERILRKHGPPTGSAIHRCGVQYAFSKLLNDPDLPIANWRRFFGRDYAWTETHAIECVRLAHANSTAFINALQVFLDLVLDKLHKHDKALGAYQLGNVGGILTSVRLRASYPKTFALVKVVHRGRSQSRLSHAVNRQTGRKTRNISEPFVASVKMKLKQTLIELSKVI